MKPKTPEQLVQTLVTAARRLEVAERRGTYDRFKRENVRFAEARFIAAREAVLKALNAPTLETRLKDFPQGNYDCPEGRIIGWRVPSDKDWHWALPREVAEAMDKEATNGP